MASAGRVPELTLREKLDLVPAHLSVIAAGIYAAITGAFRGKAGAKTYGKHVMYAIIRRGFVRVTPRQSQYVMGRLCQSFFRAR